MRGKVIGYLKLSYVIGRIMVAISMTTDVYCVLLNNFGKFMRREMQHNFRFGVKL